MLKNVSRLEHKIGERIFHFICDSDSPLVEVKEVLFQFTKFIGQVEDNIAAQQEAVKITEKEPVEIPEAVEPLVIEEPIAPELPVAQDQ